MTRTLTIDHRFKGPPASGNGGYVCGLLAEEIDAPAQVRLHLPPPLEEPLELIREGDVVRLMHGADLVAEGRPAAPLDDLAPPPAPDWEAVEEATAHYRGRTDHGFPECFVCGLHRAEGDGLRLFPGPASDADARAGRVAVPFTPAVGLAGRDRLTLTRFIWAALDCPGFWAAELVRPKLAAVLGTMTAEIRRQPAPGEPCRIVGWALGGEGRKHSAATALYDEEGALLALARQTWIALNTA